jgi:hypothetical protein
MQNTFIVLRKIKTVEEKKVEYAAKRKAQSDLKSELAQHGWRPVDQSK